MAVKAEESKGIQQLADVGHQDLIQNNEANNGTPGFQTTVLSWDAQTALSHVDLDKQRSDQDRLTARASDDAPDSTASINYDQGDTNQLDSTGRRRGSSVEPGPLRVIGTPPTADVVRFAGTNPAVSSHAATVLPLEAAAADFEDDELQATTYSDSESLGQAIRAALCSSANGSNLSFLPFDHLDDIINRNSVYKVLQRLGPAVGHELDKLTDQIWGLSSSVSEGSPRRTRHSGEMTTRRKLFAILALLGKCDEIQHFINEDIFDADLPFEQIGEEMYRKGHDGPVPIVLFRRKIWRYHDVESFDRYQRQFLAPYFKLKPKGNKVIHYVFADKDVLPFIEDDQKVLIAHGGFADVWRVVIHPAHHDGCPDSALENNPPYAVKRLKFRPDSQAVFKREVDNLKKIQDHPHVIKLLATFSYQDHYYLLFPWATGNLLEFWQNYYPHPDKPRRSHELVKWFANQCLGIVEGLSMIHNLGNAPSNALSPHSASEGNIHGRHGDVKPTNILWFKGHENVDLNSMGHFKICDFGMADFHRLVSMNVSSSKVGMSRTYRAPEFDIIHSVTPDYDIWPLGCLLLEFVTWYIYGYEDVEGFSKRRIQDDRPVNPPFYEDTFFNLINGTNQKAQLKKSVAKQFNKLRKHPECTDYFIELLNYIEDSLLRMEPNKRKTSAAIVVKFRELQRRCQDDADYSNKKTECPPSRVNTDLSELAASPDPSTWRRRSSTAEYTHRARSPPSQNTAQASQGRPQSPELYQSLQATHIDSDSSATEAVMRDAAQGQEMHSANANISVTQEITYRRSARQPSLQEGNSTLSTIPPSSMATSLGNLADGSAYSTQMTTQFANTSSEYAFGAHEVNEPSSDPFPASTPVNLPVVSNGETSNIGAEGLGPTKLVHDGPGAHDAMVLSVPPPFSSPTGLVEQDSQIWATKQQQSGTLPNGLQQISETHEEKHPEAAAAPSSPNVQPAEYKNDENGHTTPRWAVAMRQATEKTWRRYLNRCLCCLS